jgi:hypothetical protein
MHKVNTTLNIAQVKILGPTGYIAYLKSEEWRSSRITISHLKSFILSNYNSLILTANKSLDREVRTSALLRLEKNLKTT